MTESKTDWRLIDTGSLSGPENMAIDEALLSCFNPETSTPVLRLYGWSPPAFSLGRFQDAAAVLDLDRCRDEGVRVVRRVTGGGAIFHAEEITYSIVCAPRHLPPDLTIKESFRVLTGFLVEFYRMLGLSSCYARDCTPSGVPLGERTSFCFAGRESYDILIDGRKIGGNAQRRLKSVIFQHGSIPLRDTVATALRFLKTRPDGVEDSVTDLATFGVMVEESELKMLMTGSFAKTRNVVLSPDALSGAERKMAEALGKGKYTADSWNLAGDES